jgi:hypothetical protein
MAGAAGVPFGLGRSTPRRAGSGVSADPGGVSVSPGNSAGIFRGRLVIVSGPGSGVFVYSPKPGAGNLVASISAAAGLDPYGNSVSPGFTVYSGGTFAQLNSGALEMGDAAAGVFLSIFGSVLSLAAAYGSPSFAVTIPVTATAGTAANPTVITTDSWNAAALLNGWANAGGGLYEAQYRLCADNTVHLIGVINSAAMTATQFMTLPAGYRPLNTGGDHPIGEHTTTPLGTEGAFLRVGTTGACSIINSAVASGIIVFNTRIPLDNI